MKKWEQFEIDCTKYLNEEFGEYATFTHQGRSDSTIPDIKVETNNNTEFYIEAKNSPAQCGQFVLQADETTNTFSYSKKNKSKENEFSKKIVDFMNNNFTTFVNAGTSGEEIDTDNCEDLFASWIINNYKEKNVKLIITNNYILLPLEKLPDYFKIKGKFRIKKSGSSKPPKKYYDDIKQILSQKYNIFEHEEKDGRYLVNTTQKFIHEKFKIGKYTYAFMDIDNDLYEIRKLSNTFNTNVIFSICLKDNISGLTKEEIIKKLSS